MGIGMGGFPRKEVERGEVEKIAEKNRTPIKKVITTEEGWCKDVIYYSEEVSTIVDFVEYYSYYDCTKYKCGIPSYLYGIETGFLLTRVLRRCGLIVPLWN